MTPYVLVSGDFVTTGGMDRANYALAAYLARNGHPVRLVTHRADAGLAGLPGVSVRQVPKPANSYLLGSPWLARIGRAEARLIAQRGGRVVVNAGNCSFPDASWVHYVHAAYRPALAGNIARRAQGFAKGVYFRWQERLGLQAARVVIANSELTRRHLIEHLGVAPDAIHVVYLGTDPEIFRPSNPDERKKLRAGLGLPAERPAVTFVGAPGDGRKGFAPLFSAWERLAKDPHWDSILLVIGGGDDVAHWTARAAQLGDSIRFLGFRRDVPDVLRCADALVAPTRYEPYGLGVHEALCCGLAGLVSADAGIAERYPPALRSLLMDNPADPTEIADCLQRWRRDIDGARRLVEPFGEKLRAWTWDPHWAENRPPRRGDAAAGHDASSAKMTMHIGNAACKSFTSVPATCSAAWKGS